MKITERDKNIIEFLQDVGVANTKTISILFFNSGLRRCSQRLKILVDNKKIKVFRENILEQNIYYIGRKPSQWKHKIIFSNLMAKLHLEEIEVLKYRCPFVIESVIADGLIVVRCNDVVKIYFVEVERTKKLDINKYESLYYSRKWRSKFPCMPSIICISDKTFNIDSAVVDVLQLQINLDDIFKLRLELF